MSCLCWHTTHFDNQARPLRKCNWHLWKNGLVGQISLVNGFVRNEHMVPWFSFSIQKASNVSKYTGLDQSLFNFLFFWCCNFQSHHLSSYLFCAVISIFKIIAGVENCFNRGNAFAQRYSRTVSFSIVEVEFQNRKLKSGIESRQTRGFQGQIASGFRGFVVQF